MANLIPQYEQRDIYYFFVKTRALFNNRGFRMPSKQPFDEWMKAKPKLQQETLRKITERFNSIWCNVEPQLYFDCGFRLFGKSFFFHKFFEPAIMIKYSRDRMFKVHSEQTIKDKTKAGIKCIAAAVRSEDPEINSVEEYFKKKTGYMPVFIQHFLREQINEMILAYVWMKHRSWISYVDPDILDTYLGTFKRRVYKHISYLTEHQDLFQIIDKSFQKI